MTFLNFPAGTYYIGDPCYAFQGNNWASILDESDYFNSETKTRNMWAGSTAYGDGYYTDQFGNKYPVDAGLIGIMPIEMCDFRDIRWENNQWIDDRGIIGSSGVKIEFKPGNVVTFENDFIVQYENGKFQFAHIAIDTDPDYEEDDEYYDISEDGDLDDVPDGYYHIGND